MDSAVWRLLGAQASLDGAPLSVSVDLERPGHGLTVGEPFQGGLFLGVGLGDSRAVATAPKTLITVQDAYVRGSDLVATYEQTPERPVRTTLYWRALTLEAAPGALLAIELVVSVQTSLLESQPTLDVYSQLPAAELLAPDAQGNIAADPAESQASAAAAHCTLVRFEGANFSYLELLHPTAFADSRVDTRIAGAMSLLHRLFFPADLEKGVILRARLRGIFLPRAGDSEAAAGYYRGFLASPPPLTT